MNILRSYDIHMPMGASVQESRMAGFLSRLSDAGLQVSVSDLLAPKKVSNYAMSEIKSKSTLPSVTHSREEEGR